MATHSSTLVWKIPWTEESGRLQSMGSQRVRRDWETSLSLLTFMHWRRKWQPTPVFLPGESQGRGSLLGCRLWVAQNRTRLKRLRSSSSRNLTGQKKKKKKKSHWAHYKLDLSLLAGSVESAGMSPWLGGTRCPLIAQNFSPGWLVRW